MALASLFQKSRTRPQNSADAGPPLHTLVHNKACNQDDFRHPSLWGVIRGIFLHDQLRFGDAFPVHREDRHHWQAAMTARAMTEMGVLGPRSQILGVGAGNAPIVFWLTNKVGQIFATDLYLRDGSPAATLYQSMISEPARHWPGSWNPRRLVVQHMDPLELRYDDASFDGVFAIHVLERFSSEDDTAQALNEIYRVLKPGGLASLHLEFQSDGRVLAPGETTRRLIPEAEIRENFIAALPWVPVDSLDLGLSDATRKAEQEVASAEADVRRCVETHGQLLWHELTRDRYPFLTLRDGDRLSCCVHLALRKPK
jgi:ubiquinone/menaquinone biosynthesis C-methylase UbiE